VHLPLDLNLGHHDPAERRRGCRATLRAMQLTRPLAPAVHVLHLDRHGWESPADPEVAAWRTRVAGSLDALLDAGADPTRLAVESLDYPLALAADLVRERGMPFCLDIGHLLRYGHDMGAHIDEYLPETAIIHAHGVAGGKDHLGLDRLAEPAWRRLALALQTFRGTLCLEVFTLERLRASLARMAELP